MTALDRYARLESTGLWRPAPEGQRRDVGVSFGAATLVIADTAGRPLAHWSLPAIRRLNPAERPALYAPDVDGTETLEIDDTTMVEAIETVRRSLERRRSRPGRLRRSARWGIAALVLGLLVLWLPGALFDQALSSLPAAKRSEIGATLLGHLQRVTGPACRNPLGLAALDRLKSRVLGPEAPGQVVVLPGEVPGALYLPGGIIVLDRAMVEGAASPASVAGHILAAAVRRDGADPLGPLLREAGIGATMTLLTTGDLPPDVIEADAQRLATNPPPRAAADHLLAAFDLRRVPIGPWAEEVGDVGLAVAPPAARTAPVMSDGDWVSLQGICRG